MGRIVQLLRQEPQARLFFLAYGQSSLGTGAGFVALVLVAYERFNSPWAIALVLLADLVPPTLLGPIFGAAADRWSRRTCAVVADVVRGLAFVGMAFVDSFAATLVLALLAGIGTGLFKPAIMAGLPSLVGRQHLAQVTALYGVLTELGYAAGPALAALFLIFGSGDELLAVNGATFVLSSVIVTRLRFGRAAVPEGDAAGLSLFAEARAGLRATVRMPGVRAVILGTAAVLLFGGMINVAELVLVKELDAGNVGYSLLVTASGLGVAAGSLVAASGGPLSRLRLRYLLGVLLFGLGLVATGVAPALPVAMFTLGAAGVGNGLVIVYERLIIQTVVPDHLLGRVFGIQYSLDGAAFAVAFIAAGAALTLIGPRALFIAAGAGAVLVWALSALALRFAWRDGAAAEAEATPEDGTEALAAGGIEAGR